MNISTPNLNKRSGAIGALLDIYEIEVNAFIETFKLIDDSKFSSILNEETKDEDCKSFKSIINHLINADKFYLELIKQKDNPDYTLIRPNEDSFNINDGINKLQDSIQKFISYLESRKETPTTKNMIKTPWGDIMDEQNLIEHAIVHIMRHHRQIIKFIL